MPLPENFQPKAKPPVIDNTEIVRAFRANGGHILHLRPLRDRRGVTFAYVERNGRVEFSTAVQHQNDGFMKKIGTKTAIEHFLAGRAVTLPLRKGRRAHHALKDTIYFLL